MEEQTTRGFGEFAVGMTLRNNDTRKAGETVTVTAVSEGFVFYHTGKRKVRVNKNRVFFDGRYRAKGFNVVA